MQHKKLPQNLIAAKAWWVYPDWEIGEELDPKELDFLNIGLQMGEEFISPSIEINSGFHFIAQANHETEEIYCFFVDFAYIGEVKYEGIEITGIKIPPNKIEEFKEELEKYFGETY